MESVRQLQRHVKTGQDIAVVDRQLCLEPFSGHALAPDPVLLLGEQPFGDPIGVVGAQELALLSVQAAQQLGDPCAFRRYSGVECLDVVTYVVADAATMLRPEFDARVVRLDR